MKNKNSAQLGIKILASVTICCYFNCCQEFQTVDYLRLWGRLLIKKSRLVNFSHIVILQSETSLFHQTNQEWFYCNLWQEWCWGQLILQDWWLPDRCQEDTMTVLMIISIFYTYLYLNLAGSWKMWKNLFFFAAVPVIIASTVNAFYLADPSEMDPPPFVPYDHLRIRTKVIIWCLITNQDQILFAEVSLGRWKPFFDPQSPHKCSSWWIWTWWTIIWWFSNLLLVFNAAYEINIICEYCCIYIERQYDIFFIFSFNPDWNT